MIENFSFKQHELAFPANKNFSESGNVIKAGASKQRISLGANLKNKNDTKFDVAIKDKIWAENAKGLNKIYLKHWFKPLILDNGETIYVNINSLSKRLGIAKSTIEKTEDLKTLIKKRLPLQEKIIDQYEKIISNNDSKIKQLGLTKKELMKAVREATLKLFPENELKSISHAKQLENGMELEIIDQGDEATPQIQTKHITTLEDGVFKKNRFLIAEKDGENLKFLVSTEIPSIHQTHINHYDFDSLSIDHAENETPNGFIASIDYSFDENLVNVGMEGTGITTEQSQKALKAKFNTCNTLYTDANTNYLRGIEDKPKSDLIEIKSPNSSTPNVVGYVGEKYDCDLTKIKNFSKRDKLKIASDILHGFLYLKEKNIEIDYNIQKENILIRKKNNGEVSAHISIRPSLENVPPKISDAILEAAKNITELFEEKEMKTADEKKFLKILELLEFPRRFPINHKTLTQTILESWNKQPEEDLKLSENDISIEKAMELCEKLYQQQKQNK